MQISFEDIVEDEDDKGDIDNDAAGEIELGCTVGTLAHLVEQLTGAELDTQLHSISLHCTLTMLHLRAAFLLTSVVFYLHHRIY